MKEFTPETIERLEAGEVDYRDAVTMIFDSGVVNFWIGGKGQFEWTDDTIGTQTFHGGGQLLTMEVPPNSLTNQSDEITLRLSETYMVEGSDVPRNIFDDPNSPSIRATIDDEPWEGREVILSVFWVDVDGNVLMREQIDRRAIDAMPQEIDAKGFVSRMALLERADIINRDIEGKTSNAEFQRQIDATDSSYDQVGTTQNQKINFGKIQDETTV